MSSKAHLLGLAVLLFLRDWRSALVVVMNIPLALCCSILALWLTGETINATTLGGLALAIGILVDEATVEVENIHSQMAHTDSIALAVRLGNAQTAVPRLLAMLCILAVFIPAFFMQGAAQRLFAPLAMAVGFAMVRSYILSSTFVPVVSVWLLRHFHYDEREDATLFGRLRRRYERSLSRLVSVRWIVLGSYLAIALLIVLWQTPRIGREIFPVVDAGQCRLRIRAPDGFIHSATAALSFVRPRGQSRSTSTRKPSVFDGGSYTRFNWNMNTLCHEDDRPSVSQLMD